MATILKHKSRKSIYFFQSISFKILLLCIVSFFICLFSSHLLISESINDSIFKTKQSELSLAASEFSASLSDYAQKHNTPSPPPVSGNMTRRFLIINNSLKIVYDSSDIQNLTEKTLYLPSTISAINGNTFFSCHSNASSIESVLCSPIITNGKISGVVLVSENDKSYALLFKTLQINFLIATLFIGACVIGLALFISFLIRQKIKDLIDTIKSPRELDAPVPLSPVLRDEFSPAFDEFNSICNRLDYVQKMRQAFVSDASHELRTPLAAIKLLCESITHSKNLDAETYNEFMEDIILEVDRMSQTADKLLVLSKLDNPTTSATAPVSLTDIVYSAISTLSPLAEAKNITIESYIEENCVILADLEGANQIISNLIDNAIKYNRVDGTLRIYLFSKKGRCVFITDDTGIGIPPEYREQIFERFFRVDNSRKNDGRGGSGLGLAIVKQNIEALGGSISVSDSVNGGSRFTVVLPGISYEDKGVVNR